ncbi:hypothetical protein [Winogradskyella sp. UBA3174]|uniref:hypothetical protein n=1 Tax=Winogradskyella sp. UBA3174 TaxID=1947785 RepID=UPI0025E7A02B|nr:hypothetical protein [Winogradskyella sp. UBA3174]|tara:strand:- start:4065 stop:4769 length:705 start_codon:yes stop_codon:yes gene_type:complete
MKHITMAMALLLSVGVFAQTNADLKKHYKTFLETMKTRGDVQGVINAHTHLDILEPSVERKDTLAYLYLSNGNYMQALNTIGIEKNEGDSNMNTEVKALALKSLNRPKLALEHYEVLFKRDPNPTLAYEIADMKVQVDDLVGAKSNIEYGLTNVKDDMKHAFYETQQPYEASLKAAFLCLKGLLVFKENQDTNLNVALKLMNEALEVDPNFNLARISRDALEAQKAQKTTTTKN